MSYFFYMNEIIINRLEHRVSKLGPFMHKGARNYQSKLVLKLNFHSDPDNFEEYKSWIIEKGFDKNNLPSNWVFGWYSEQGRSDFIRSNCNLNYYKFDWVKYKVKDYLILPDGQVIFNNDTALKIE